MWASIRVREGKKKKKNKKKIASSLTCAVLSCCGIGVPGDVSAVLKATAKPMVRGVENILHAYVRNTPGYLLANIEARGYISTRGNLSL